MLTPDNGPILACVPQSRLGHLDTNARCEADDVWNFAPVELGIKLAFEPPLQILEIPQAQETFVSRLIRRPARVLAKVRIRQHHADSEARIFP
jgi:hypothetical protein